MEASVHLKAREYSWPICSGEGKELDSERPFAVEGFTHMFVLYFQRKGVVFIAE